MKDNYWSMHYKGRTQRAHRLVWEWEKGPIPEGMHVHHTCENPQCVNTDHMLLLSSSEHQTLHTTGNKYAVENDAKSKAVAQVCMETGTVTIYPSMCEAQRRGYSQAAISCVCSGKREQHKGSWWRKV